jgi:hypothetical protein
MPRLVIEYLLQGYTPGYNFTTPTSGIEEESLKVIWRNAFPRGQGWANYIGAQSVKVFQVKENLYAISDVTVTDIQDEAGRRGIRRADIDLYTLANCVDHLNTRLRSYPIRVRAEIERKSFISEWERILKHTMQKVKGEPQAILTHTFADDWQMMEALVLKLALFQVGPIKKWGKLSSFTTLALEYREESRIVALPKEHTTGIKVPIIDVK